jgi:hypothetical protein
MAAEPALVVSVIALFVALGGTGYAAFSLPKSSVGAQHLKNGAVATKKLKNGVVTTSKLNNGAVITSKIKDHAVTRAKLDVTGLTVPNAVHANSADIAGNATSATHATSATQATTATHATSADSANSVAYAHVLLDGTLDSARSKNVSASNPSQGVYCLKVGVAVANASATVDFANSGGTGKFGITSAVLSGQDSPNVIGNHCPAGDNALVGTADSTTGTIDNRAFWITFN